MRRAIALAILTTAAAFAVAGCSSQTAGTAVGTPSTVTVTQTIISVPAPTTVYVTSEPDAPTPEVPVVGNPTTSDTPTVVTAPNPLTQQLLPADSGQFKIAFPLITDTPMSSIPDGQRSNGVATDNGSFTAFAVAAEPNTVGIVGDTVMLWSDLWTNPNHTTHCISKSDVCTTAETYHVEVSTVADTADPKAAVDWLTADFTCPENQAGPSATAFAVDCSLVPHIYHLYYYSNHKIYEIWGVGAEAQAFANSLEILG